MQTGDHRRIAFRCVTIALLLCCSVSPAAGEPAAGESETPWYSGRSGHHRLRHLTITAAFGLGYLASATVLSPMLASTSCRWCEPPVIDRQVRDAIVWRDPGRANLLSNIDAYVLAPVIGFGLLVASDYDAGWSRLFDDTIPVAETIAISQFITQAIKFSVARQRPYVHFGTASRGATSDDNTSFISGHSVLGLSITASAGLICHWRHYWTEPYVWGSGIALSLSVEYLRMGADKHYLSDVLVGGAVGLASGLLIPRLMREDIQIVPVGNGLAVAGRF